MNYLIGLILLYFIFRLLARSNSRSRGYRNAGPARRPGCGCLTSLFLPMLLSNLFRGRRRGSPWSGGSSWGGGGGGFGGFGGGSFGGGGSAGSW